MVQTMKRGLLPWLVPAIMLVGVLAVAVGGVVAGVVVLFVLVWFALPRALASVRESGDLPRWMTWNLRDLGQDRRHRDR